MTATSSLNQANENTFAGGWIQSCSLKPVFTALGDPSFLSFLFFPSLRLTQRCATFFSNFTTALHPDREVSVWLYDDVRGLAALQNRYTSLDPGKQKGSSCRFARLNLRRPATAGQSAISMIVAEAIAKRSRHNLEQGIHKDRRQQSRNSQRSDK